MKTGIRLLAAGLPLFLAACVTTAAAPEKPTPAPTAESIAAEPNVLLACEGKVERRARRGANASDAFINNGWAEIERGDPDTARGVFVSALSLFVENPRAYWGLGVASHLSGFSQQTVSACFDAAIAKLPANAALYSDFGRVLEERNLDRRAVEKFTKAVALDDGWIEAHVGLARAYTKLGDAQLAARHIEKVRKLKAE